MNILYTPIDHETEKGGYQAQICSPFAVRFNRHIIYTREDTISKVAVLTHDQYIDDLIDVKRISWLNQLKVCIMIYTGELNGFSDISDLLSERQNELLPVLPDRLLEALDESFEQIQKEQDPTQRKNEERFLLETAIEFCLILKMN